ncbi:hypothetical protein AKJ09_00559 [Labilithrix luteola]|uniref:FAD-binding PCMH-type domain-containing protein n=1 Tax=Labilithrix luteola TaxID=1391654 RepID=A0A0K1PK38_9BACT|nr:FAD-binding protein [Labilithrix luteola]AKU93895.1 hypothetical protein AKJ09_00559 [Labilithrix luteola]
MGGLDETVARVHRPRNIDELRALLEGASSASGRTFSLVGGRHSFGDHFFPDENGEAIDTTGLGADVVVLEDDEQGRRWVRASGSTTFEGLALSVSGFSPHHPPTSDLITLAGALAACTHDSFGFFCDHVRRFSVLTVDGRIHDCHRSASGIAGELFRLVPGSFGALGIVLDIELRLFPVGPDRFDEVAVARCRAFPDDLGLTQLETVAERPGQRGAGLYFYGLRGKVVLFDSRLVDAKDAARLPALPLADDSTKKNIYLQALANRVPAVVQWLSPHVLREGQRFRASVHGHAFFQRSYGRSYALLTGQGLGARALAAIGVNPRLPVVHQTFVIPRPVVRRFLDSYFDRLERHPELVSRIEQQDMVKLPVCRWPLHGTFGLDGGGFLFTASMSVPRGSALERRGRDFLGTVARCSFEELGVKTLLTKHLHGHADLFACMHRDAIEALLAIKSKVDSHGVLSSRFLKRLCREARAERRSRDAGYERESASAS